MYEKEVIKQCIEECKDFKTLKEYQNYLKEYNYNEHKGLFPIWVQNKIRTLQNNQVWVEC